MHIIHVIFNIVLIIEPGGYPGPVNSYMYIYISSEAHYCRMYCSHRPGAGVCPVNGWSVEYLWPHGEGRVLLFARFYSPWSPGVYWSHWLSGHGQLSTAAGGVPLQRCVCRLYFCFHWYWWPKTNGEGLLTSCPSVPYLTPTLTHSSFP